MWQAVAEYEAQKKNGTLVTYSLENVMKENGITHEDLATADI